MPYKSGVHCSLLMSAILRMLRGTCPDFQHPSITSDARSCLWFGVALCGQLNEQSFQGTRCRCVRTITLVQCVVMPRLLVDACRHLWQGHGCQSHHRRQESVGLFVESSLLLS